MSGLQQRDGESLRSSARGLLTFIEVHELRGNAAAVADAEAELDAILTELARADGVRRLEYAYLNDLGPTPVNGARVARIRRRMARSRS